MDNKADAEIDRVFEDAKNATRSYTLGTKTVKSFKIELQTSDRGRKQLTKQFVSGNFRTRNHQQLRRMF